MCAQYDPATLNDLSVSLSASLFYTLHPFPFTSHRLLRNNILYNVFNFGLGWSTWTPIFCLGNFAATHLNASASRRRPLISLCPPSVQSQMKKRNEKLLYFKFRKRIYFAESHAWGSKVVYPFLCGKKYLNFLNHNSLATVFVYCFIQSMTS